MTSLILIKLTQQVFKNSKDSLGVSIKQLFFSLHCGISKIIIMVDTFFNHHIESRLFPCYPPVG